MKRGSVKSLVREPDLLERRRELLGAGPCRPAPLEVGERARELAEVGPVGALVGARLRRAPRPRSPGRRAAAISASSMTWWFRWSAPLLNAWLWTTSTRRLETCAKLRATSSTWTTGRHGLPSLKTVTMPVVKAAPHEVVEDGVESHPRRHAVDGAVAEEGRREPVVGQLRERHLALDLRARVLGLRIERRLLVDDLGRRQPVHDAGRGEEEPPHSGLSGELREPHGRVVVDLLRPALVEVPDRVVAESGEVDDGVEAVDVVGRRRRGCPCASPGSSTESGTSVQSAK